MASTRRGSPNLAPERCSAAVLLIDVINRFDFEGSEALLKTARPAARAIARLKKRAIEAKVPIVYVNDNFGRWRSDFRAIVRTCCAAQAKAGAREIARRLAPTARDYFVLKPTNSAFHGTVLETLLRHLGAETLVLAGFATDKCVLFTVSGSSSGPTASRQSRPRDSAMPSRSWRRR
jgi:nicotinamidase-related amidase